MDFVDWLWHSLLILKISFSSFNVVINASKKNEPGLSVSHLSFKIKISKIDNIGIEQERWEEIGRTTVSANRDKLRYDGNASMYKEFINSQVILALTGAKEWIGSPQLVF
jgi:hypothetical protein